jgi:hypothetical protein
MGFFDTMRYSHKKTKELYKFYKLLDHNNTKPITSKEDILNNRKDEVWDNFYSFLLNDRYVGLTIKNNNLSLEEIKEISLMLYMCTSGRGGYVGGNYVPLAAFAFGPPLEYLIKNRDNFKKGIDAFYNLYPTIEDYFKFGHVDIK